MDAKPYDVRTQAQPAPGEDRPTRNAFLPLLNGDEHLKPSKRGNFALWAALVYAGAALAWIFLFDIAVDLIASDKIDQTYLQTAKGAAFVALTSVLLFFVLKSAQRREISLATRLRDAIDASRDGLWRWDLINDSIAATHGGDTELGWSAAETIRDLNGWRAIVHPDDWVLVGDLVAYLHTSEDDRWQIEQRFRTNDGGWHWFQIKGRVSERTADGAVAVVEGTYHSIDALKRAQISLERANMALRILVATHEAISEGKTQAGIFWALVQRIGQWPECACVWIGEARNDDEKRIVPIAWAGSASDFATSAELRWDDSPYGCGPSGTCIKTGSPSLISDVREEESSKPWRELSESFGIRSGISIPIIPDDGPKYLLHIAGRSPQLFPMEDSGTYEMISKVLAFTVRSIDTEFRYTLSESARTEMADRLQKAMQGSIAALATVVEKRDPYTSGHQHRVAELAVAFGRKIGLSEDRLEGLRIGAWIHDVGKIGVPTEILSKPGHLDETEIALIRRHAEIGYEIVKSIDFGWPVDKILYQHHERWDGSGYPQGLMGEDIALEARIVAVADVIESMGTDRPYRPKIPWQRVIDEITGGRGTRYDAQVVDAAMSVLDGGAASFGFNTK